MDNKVSFYSSALQIHEKLTKMPLQGSHGPHKKTGRAAFGPAGLVFGTCVLVTLANKLVHLGASVCADAFVAHLTASYPTIALPNTHTHARAHSESICRLHGPLAGTISEVSLMVLNYALLCSLPSPALTLHGPSASRPAPSPLFSPRTRTHQDSLP